MGGGHVGEIIEAEARRPGFGEAFEMVEEIRRRHGGSVAAVLFYGSCRRTGWAADSVLDFYALVDGYRAAYAGWAPAFFNWLLPPNVHYVDLEREGRHIRAKYAVFSMAQFSRGAGPDALLSSVWGRFAQPTSILYARGPAEDAAVLAALAQSARTMMANARPLVGAEADARTLWTTAFRESYRSELRSESDDRYAHLYEASEGFYEALAAAVPPDPRSDRASLERRWARRRLIGKLMAVLRHIKAAYTFENGLEYVLWKIERHSGISVPVTPWQKRHPLLAAPRLAWTLYRRGAFR